MRTTPWKPNLLSTILVRALSFGVLILLARLVYVVTIRGNSCNSGDFCFFSVPETVGNDISSTAAADIFLNYYLPTFLDLAAEHYLNPNSKSLCIGTLARENAVALREISVTDSISISISKNPIRLPFDDNTFDLVFTGKNAGLDRSSSPAKFASEVTRTLKQGGFFVVHTAAKDSYSLNSLLNLFNSCRLIRSREFNSQFREIVLKKEIKNGVSVNNSMVAGYKLELIKKLEPLIMKEEQLNTLRSNAQNISYLPSMVDISFKHRYIYMDVGARNYVSSIGSWFRKKYPKQNKNFEIYAIEADKAFHEEYRLKKGVTLLPYAAWIRNETLFFEINRGATGRNEEKVTGMGMGRIQSVHSSSKFVGDLNKIEGFDFADWLKRSVSEKDFVVVKMDVEGSEFHLIPRLVESGGIGLIDEMFIECHYDRWRTFDQCLELFSSLREKGVFVHQWWLVTRGES